jgi:hypothetical protein
MARRSSGFRVSLLVDVLGDHVFVLRPEPLWSVWHQTNRSWTVRP